MQKKPESLIWLASCSLHCSLQRAFALETLLLAGVAVAVVCQQETKLVVIASLIPDATSGPFTSPTPNIRDRVGRSMISWNLHPLCQV